MNIVTTIFYFFIGLAALSAAGILFEKNVLKAALLLLVCLLAIAALYILAFAEFIAVAQILIYAGGVLVVIVFGIMITSKLSGKSLTAGSTHWVPGIIAGAGMFIILIQTMKNGLAAGTVSPTPPPSGMQNIGISLITTYALPFEVAGVLLLVALIGAAVMASFMKSNKSDAPH